MKKYRNIISAVALMCSSSVSMVGQDVLNKEIVVAKDYVPTEQKATKLNNLPEVSKVEVTNLTLNYSDWAVPATVKPSLSTLKPLGFANTASVSKKRGYVNFGMGTLLNMTGSAGYKILGDEVNTLNVWLQHNSTWGGLNNTINVLAEPNDHNPGARLFEQKYINDIFGVDYSRKIGSNILSANAYYHFSRFNYFGAMMYGFDESFQNVNEFNVALSYGTAPKEEGLKYSLGLSYDHFGYEMGLKENDFILNGDISTQIGEQSRLGIDLKGEMIHYSSILIEDEFLKESTSTNYGMLSLSPYYHLQNETMNLKLGLNVDLSFNDGTIFRFSPNINFDYKLSNKIIFYTDVTGGKKLNKFSELTTENPYINPHRLIANSYTPFDFVAGFKFGSFSGFTAQIWGGYAIVNNQQLPWSLNYEVVTPDGPNPNPTPPYAYPPPYIDMLGTDMSGFQVGLELGYKYNNIAELKTKFAYSPQDNKKGYMFSFDRPEFIVGVDLTVDPIDKLKIIASYEYQRNRNMWSYIYYSPAYEYVNERSLGNVNQLKLHVSYALNDTFSFFVQGNNLLNAKWDKYPFMGAQKINFLAGVSVVF